MIVTSPCDTNTCSSQTIHTGLAVTIPVACRPTNVATGACASTRWNAFSSAHSTYMRLSRSPGRGRVHDNGTLDSAEDPLQLRHGGDGSVEVFTGAGLNGVTSAQPRRNIDAVQRGCSSTARGVA